ncbi:LysE family translocator [Sneathiella glossodoripedis]|uniref:LysE family translocator n=1 Tax=Sneathiella glossodoripedis TaxID=418853 RepID=UPI00046E5386|nr:LysE family translocator [Sneathiella glossodoripedis]
MLPELSTVILYLSAVFMLTIAPGPDIIYVAMRGLAQGWKAGLIAALGLVTGIFVHILLAALGLSAILASSPVLFAIVKYAGAAYLVYIGWQIYKSPAVSIGADNRQLAIGHIYRQTILMSILNPKVALFFLAFLPQFVDTSSEYITVQFIIFGVLFQLTALLIMGFVGLFAGAITAKLNNGNERGSTWLTQIAGGAVMALGALIPMKDIWALFEQN